MVASPPHQPPPFLAGHTTGGARRLPRLAPVAACHVLLGSGRPLIGGRLGQERTGPCRLRLRGRDRAHPREGAQNPQYGYDEAATATCGREQGEALPDARPDTRASSHQAKARPPVPPVDPRRPSSSAWPAFSTRSALPARV